MFSLVDVSIGLLFIENTFDFIYFTKYCLLLDEICNGNATNPKFGIIMKSQKFD